MTEHTVLQTWPDSDGLKRPQEIATEIVRRVRSGRELTVDDVRLVNFIEQAIIDDRRRLKNQFLRLAADAFD